MKRTIIAIDADKCNGCRQCVDACHEGAIQMVDGKARLISDIYCDGLGDCIGECPTGAITKVEREAEAYDQAAVDRHLREQGHEPAPAAHGPQAHNGPCHGGCPGAAMRQMARPATPSAPSPTAQPATDQRSQLGHWPVQLRLVPPNAPFLAGADLLICADCVPFTVPDFHERYLRDRVVVTACPKLDPAEINAARIEALMQHSGVRSVTVLRMEVPCCGGLAQQTIEAWKHHAPSIPCAVHTVGIQGGIDKQTMVCA
ncbi:MAG: ATP-binding protein [Planctomycetota bacterium]